METTITGTAEIKAYLINLLKQYHLHITGPRKKVLEAFLIRNTAVTPENIRQHCGCSIDRVTLYRTLSLFLQAKLIHQLPSMDGVIRYALRPHSDIADKNHLHFICEQCKQTYCLHHLPVPEAALPVGYLVTEISFIIKGICNHCNAS